jgi:hypothetical protein
MLHFFKKLLMFRIGQKAARGFTRSIGLGKISQAAGLVGGYRNMKRHA